MSDQPKTAMTTSSMGPLAPPPDFITEGKEGLENVRGGDIIVPILKMAQSISPKVVDGGLPLGSVYSSLSDDVLAQREQPLEFIPVFHYLQWILWGDLQANEGVIEQSTDPKSALAMRCLNGNRPDENNRAVTEYHNFVAVFPDFGISQPYVIPCCKTSHKKGRMLLGLAMMRGRPLYSGRYKVSSKIEQNKAGQKYFVWHFVNSGWVEDQELYTNVQKLHTNIKDAYDENRLSANLDEESAKEPVATSTEY